MHEQNESQPKAFIKILFALFTALLVVVLGYLCIQIYTIFHRTYKTETAIAYTITLLPGRAARQRRPQAAKRLHPAVHLQHGLAWSRSLIRASLWSALPSMAL